MKTASSQVSNLVSQASAASALKYGVVTTACTMVTSIFGQLACSGLLIESSLDHMGWNSTEYTASHSTSW